MEEILGIAAVIFLIWIILTTLGFIVAHWQIFAVGAVIIAILPFIIGQRNSFLLLRTPVYAVGIFLCILIAPLDYAFLFFIEHIGAHAFIGVTRALGAPFVVISSAWFDRNSWPSYLSAWEDAHNAVKPDWDRPTKRFSELTKWLSGGHGGRE